MSQLLTDPFLQLPTPNSIRVVWFTDFAGQSHWVEFGEHLEQKITAVTQKLTHTREDQQSYLGEQRGDGKVYTSPTPRLIWRHEAEVANLQPNQHLPYRVVSCVDAPSAAAGRDNGDNVITSRIFSLSPAPTPGTPLKILLTSDHQIKPMVAANLQKVVETVGRVDAVWFAGDLVNIPDRASEWFDDNRGNAFFPCLQGNARYPMNGQQGTHIYTGGEIIQHAPMYTCIGNHEVMGRWKSGVNLNAEFDNTMPRQVALQLFGDENIKNNSFNTDTYEEIFTLPQSPTGGKTYYAVTFGDIRLVVLYATNMWRFVTTEGGKQGKYGEVETDLEYPEKWGYGQHIYEAIATGSPQYQWLERELASSEFQRAKYKVVMLHHPPHTLGKNIVPPYTDPIQTITRDETGKVIGVRYEYLRAQDYLLRDVVPLLETAQVQLVFYGHSHLWNRFTSPSGMHFLETSNVGNSYGAAYGNNHRDNIPDWGKEDYQSLGNPNGLPPQIPNIAPLLDADGNLLPYIASNEITVFSILDTGRGVISSYWFNTSNPDADVVKFDEFALGRNGK